VETEWPCRRVAAGALVFDGDGRLLIVKPTYREGWVVPGGVVEAGESPLDACRREAHEELGIDLPIGRLLAVDHVSATADRPEGYMFMFDGGILDAPAIATIRFATSELSAAEFVDREWALSRLLPRLAARVRSSFEALDSNTVLYLENGRSPVARPR
jgi:ADP-ribose pyrophosphatase YjhB (NUDIX family)